jgi:uncharacterized membrane protein YecN with MAPEG domain
MVVGPTLKRTQKVTEVEIGDPREDGFSLTWGCFILLLLQSFVATLPMLLLGSA